VELDYLMATSQMYQPLSLLVQ